MSSRGQIGLPPKTQPSKYTDKEYLWTLHQGDLLLLKREPRTEERATSFCAICGICGRRGPPRTARWGGVAQGAACVVCSRAGCRGIELDLELGVPDGRRTLSLELLYAFIYVLCLWSVVWFYAPRSTPRLQLQAPNFDSKLS